MSEYTVFKNAPITEALLDIQVVPSPDINIEKLATIQDGIKERFPARQQRSLLEFQLEAKEGGPPEVSQASGGVQGFLFLSPEADPAKAVQARIDGFAFSKLKPYETWDLFRDEAQELWERYVSIARPITVKRLGLRFINRIELPRPFHQFNQYLLTIPDIAPGLSNAVSEFFMRLVIPQPDSEATAIITVATNSIEETEHLLPVIFDIDVYVESECEPLSGAIWETFEELRRIKNDIFFKSITDDTARLFQ